MRGANTVAAAVGIVGRLGERGAPCALFGGWAEEALGITPPRPHADLDLLLPAASFESLDRLLAAAPDLAEIALKRFAHKRAFLIDGLMVEVVLVREENGTAFTWFWGDVRFEWLAPLTEACRLGGHPLSATSRENLRRYRALHRATQPWRWQDPASLVAPSGRRGIPMVMADSFKTGAAEDGKVGRGNSEAVMADLLEVRTISVSIRREWRAVYDFVRRPENFARWASGAATSLRREGGEWVADGPDGRTVLRFAGTNQFGVLDHWVTLASGAELHMPVRVVPNGSGCEVMFTLFRQPGMTDEIFARDAAWVTKDLTALKALLEA